jgi:hypothetical protein
LDNGPFCEINLTMMNKLILVFICIVAAFAQNNAQSMFGTDSTKFVKEVVSYLGQFKRDDAKKFGKEFEEIWLGGYFSASMRASVYSTANDIVVSKRKAYPDFKNYMLTVMYAAKNGFSGDKFQSFHETIEKALAEKNKSRFTSYIQATEALLEDNSIYKSSAVTWKAGSDNYTFTYDKEPIIVFEEMNVICYAKNDSSVIYKTKGMFYPYKDKWFGNGGTLTWERAELPADKFYAEIGDYKFKATKAGFSADSVQFHSTYFDDPIKGTILENVVSKRSADQVSYPKFTSYNQRLKIANIFPNVDYEGGFTMEGGKLLGSGTFEDPSKMTFQYKDKEFLVATALIFDIDKNGAIAEKASVKFNIEEDSLTHPAIYFQFKNEEQTQNITLTRGKGVTAAPFSDSYHKLDMYSEAVYWKVGDPVINFGPLFGSSDTTAKFISTDYFDTGDYDRLTGMGKNPLVQLKTISQEIVSNSLTITQCANALETSRTEVESRLYNLMVEGFLIYYKETGTVVLKEKLFNYIDQRSKRKDFDVMSIVSSSKRNAELSLVSLDLTIRGVKKVPLSDAQFVRIYPDNQELIIKKNRDLLFAGIINAGRTEYFGKQFTFDYNDFKINLVECDSMRIRPNNPRQNPNIPLRMGSKIVGISGVIEIDKPNNKSGVNPKNTKYPVLTCNKKSYVYYDDKKILKGAYKREDFKFIIEPFVMDSLDNFRNKGIAFDGEFISAGIFPNMDETLTIQKDYSFGFIKKAAKGGIGIYGNKANYENEIRLSNKGLQGSGDIDFLTSHAESTNITFFPDSVNAIAEVYRNEPREDDPEVPEVRGENVYVSYIPAQKVLYAASNDKNELHMYPDSTSRMDGRIALRPEGMTGEGRMFIENGEVLSNLFKFKHHELDADTAEFKLRTVDLDEMAFKTENVAAHINFEKRKGEFKSNDGESFVQFPENQYICYMDQFNWFLDKDDLEMESKAKGAVNIETDLDLAGSNFFSIHPDQDSLQFKSPKAKFDVRKKILTCEDVEYITVADARISPKDGIVVIKKKAKMQEFEGAEILANYITKYHNIFDATVSIFARKDYVASGYYNYIDESEGQQKFYFSNIHPDTTYQTTAKGAVKEDEKFRLSPQFDYYGDIEMKATFKELTFTGDVRLSGHTCSGIARNWMSFTAEIDPKDIYIPVATEMLDSKGQSIGAGMILNTDSIGLYSTFLSNKRSAKHIDVLTANGFLKYDKETSEYRIASREKLIEISLPGNYISLNTNDCKVYGDGKFDFGCELGLMELNPVGTLNYDPAKAELEMKATLAITFPFNEEAMDKMAKQFDDYPDLPALDFNKSTYEKSMREIVGLEKADKIISDLNIYGKIKGKMPEELLAQLYLADVNFIWDKEKNAYVSQGKIGIATTGKKQIFKQVDGKIAIFKKPTGDEISIMLNIDENTYYFFNYKRGLFQTYSSNEDYNTIISETKKDKTKFNAPKGKEDFQFMLGSKTKAIGFKRLFE